MAIDASTLDTAIENLTTAFDSLMLLVSAISYLMGLYFIFRGIAMYKVFATQTMSSANKGELAGPMVFLFVGTVLMYLPSTLDASTQSLFGHGMSIRESMGTENMIGYSAIKKSGEHWEEISEILFKYMKLIGLIAFIRGWLMISKTGHSGSQPGQLGKGIVHIVSGVLLMNIIETLSLLAETFGFSV